MLAPGIHRLAALSCILGSIHRGLQRQCALASSSQSPLRAFTRSETVSDAKGRFAATKNRNRKQAQKGFLRKGGG